MFVDWCKATDDRPGHMLVLHKGGGPIPRLGIDVFEDGIYEVVIVA